MRLRGEEEIDSYYLFLRVWLAVNLLYVRTHVHYTANDLNSVLQDSLSAILFSHSPRCARYNVIVVVYAATS